MILNDTLKKLITEFITITNITENEGKQQSN